MRYGVRAYNTASESTNKIHDDAVAQRLGDPPEAAPVATPEILTGRSSGRLNACSRADT